jgi:membrane protein implicated in regulation of membrane protease activity
MLLILAFVLLFLLPDPWNWIGFGICAVLFGGELFLWNRTVRGRRPQTGAETLIGARGVMATPCRPEGQVRVEGTLWAARSTTDAAEGTPVTVVGREELVLIVEPRRVTAPAGDG